MEETSHNKDTIGHNGICRRCGRDNHLVCSCHGLCLDCYRGE